MTDVILKPEAVNRWVVQCIDGVIPTVDDWQTMVEQACAEASLVVNLTGSDVKALKVERLTTKPRGMVQVPGVTFRPSTDDPSTFWLLSFEYHGEKFSAKAPNWLQVEGSIWSWDVSRPDAAVIGTLPPEEIPEEATILETAKTAGVVAAVIAGAGVIAWGLSSWAKLKGRRR